MKMKSFFLFALMACSSLFLNANNIETVKPSEALQQQISEMIQSSDIWTGADQNAKLVVTFTVNNDSELVILSTSNKDWDNGIKSILNYKKLNVNDAVKNKVFHLPISLERG